MQKITLSFILTLFFVSLTIAQNTCAEATSLCGSFDTVFPNTSDGSQAETDFNYLCLGSQPNPTWFYIPIATTGDVDFQIAQFTNPDGSGNQLDVDFAVWGPFTDVTCSPSDLNEANIADCSFSASAVENVNLSNVQPGEIYMLVVTNFNGNPGFIEMTETTNTNFFDTVDCTGFTLNAFVDINGNNMKDENETYFPHGSFSYSVNDEDPVILQNNSGQYYIFDNNSNNLYDFEYSINSEYTAYFDVANPILNNQSIIEGEITSFDFPVDITQPYADASISIVDLNSPNPGFDTHQLIVYSNLSNSEIPSGAIVYTFDDNTTFVSSDDTNTVQNNNTLTIPFTDLLPFESREILVTLNTNAPPEVNIDDVLSFSADISINGLDDIDLNNNTYSLDAIVIGSYDPNDKLESHGGSIIFEDFTTEDYLTYTIRFQNTGTAPAQNVVIKDFLTDELDGSTLQMISASHSYQLKKMDQDLEWEFRNINLPDSTNDEPNSHGFVHFRIKPTSGYDINTVFENTAEIFFDFNPPIITETNITAFTQRLSIDGFGSTKLSIFPNPTNSSVFVKSDDVITIVTVKNVLGQTLLYQDVNSKATSIELNNYPSGSYFVSIQSNEGTTTKRVVKN